MLKATKMQSFNHGSLLQCFFIHLFFMKLGRKLYREPAERVGPLTEYVIACTRGKELA